MIPRPTIPRKVRFLFPALLIALGCGGKKDGPDKPADASKGKTPTPEVKKIEDTPKPEPPKPQGTVAVVGALEQVPTGAYQVISFGRPEKSYARLKELATKSGLLEYPEVKKGLGE